MQTKRDNLSLGSAGLGTGTTGATIKTTLPFGYQIAGRAYSKAATDNIPFIIRTMTPAELPINVPANRTQVYFLMIDAAGNVFYTQGRKSAVDAGILRGLPGSSTAANYQASAVEWPLEENNFAVIGAIKVATNAAGAMVPGTTLFSAANQTVTYYNVAEDYGVAIPV